MRLQQSGRNLNRLVQFYKIAQFILLRYHRPRIDNRLTAAILILLKIFLEQLGQLVGLSVIGFGIDPGLLGNKNFGRDIGAGDGDGQAENGVGYCLSGIQFAAVNGVYDGAGVFQLYAGTCSGRAAGPTGADQPGMGVMVFHLFGQ